jgi:molecular chaperone DnaK (HSP70)
LRFPNNKALAPVEVKLGIYGMNNDGNTEIFNDIIASKSDKNIWSSGYSSSGKLMKFNKRNNSYTIPRLKIDLSSLNTSQYKNLTYKIELKTQSKTSDMGSLNYLFNTTSTFPITNINYTGLNEYLILYFIIPFILLLILIVFLLFYGKPQRINLVLNGYIDSYEVTDYKSFGKLITPFKSWNSDNQKVDYLLVNGGIGYRSSSFLFNWNSPIFIKLFDVFVPDGFEIFIKYKTDDIKEFGIDRRILLKKDRNNNFLFFIGIRQNNITRRLTNPELFRFKIHASYVQSKVLIRTNLEELIDYKFHLGNDLGDVWVGFDPGTTGSCVAVGSDTNNIVLIEDIRIKGANNPLRRIIPSVVGFDKDQNIELGEIINDSQFIYGNLAYTRRLEESKYDLHYSLKKLLGYKDVKRIVFKNGKTIDLQGKDLAKLLVRGLFKDMTSYFNQTDVSADEYRRKEIFNPLRAVVAIPNNSTISKVQDMVDCIANLNQFKEIRYVYEAEAVLFYYLSNFSKLSNGSTISDSETILVFDMGGATINATIVTSNKIFIDNRPKYNIDFLGKIGYGIGGDTIDYCISRFILSNSTEFPALGGINIFDKKIQLAELAFQVKKEIIANFYSNKDYLITAFNLETYINKALDVSIKINEETSKMYKYFRKDSESYKLFTHQLFTKTIYKNVKEAVNEVIHLSNNVPIDKVIFSGRSTSFPFIKETVQNELKANKGKSEIITLDLEESKVAVAKGACWYGINKNSVFLNNLKTNASFGFKKTLSVNQADVEFHELIEIGNAFDTKNDGIDSFKGKEKICDDFAFDGGKVNFYQIMGKDADKILSNGEKHKFSKIATIMPDKVTSEIAMEVSENDEVTCFVRLNNGQIIKESGVVSDQEIEDANEEHYTWIVK